MKAWRLCEERDGLPYTLFHAVEHKGSRRIHMEEWLQATVREVNDNATPYMSGFHTLPDPDKLREYAKRFKPTRTIVMVEVEIDVWHVKPTNPDVLLSEFMYLSPAAWDQRVTLVRPTSSALNAAANAFNTQSLPGTISTPASW